jgi:hypothetical protein
MQTFLPSTNFGWTAKMLDSKRLNKQILECYQILNVLSGNSPTGGWRNHPAVLMWKGSEWMLNEYTYAMIKEAKNRNIKVDKNQENMKLLKRKFSKSWGKNTPKWFNNDLVSMRIITTHRANLFNKDPMYYSRFQYATISPFNSPCCPEKKEPCKYYWPTHQEKINI